MRQLAHRLLGDGHTGSDSNGSAGSDSSATGSTGAMSASTGSLSAHRTAASVRSARSAGPATEETRLQTRSSRSLTDFYDNDNHGQYVTLSQSVLSNHMYFQLGLRLR